MQNTELAVLQDILEIDPPGSESPQQPAPERAPNAADNPATQRKPFLCRHIFTDGRRCGSPALRSQHFCYYHYAHRTPLLANARRRRPSSGFDLTRLDGLDNPTAIQLALSEVLGRIAANTVDPRNAYLLLFGLQIAGKNLRQSRPAEDPLPESIVEDADHGQLAAPEEGRTLPESTLTRIKALLETEVETQVPCAQDFDTKSMGWG
jgi:hypothetical protein